ncbi:MAG: hypothetical protein BroJett011_04180 [Chloroflexota bacterium]|nr:MAG: hypothetical protein BroJett011_04180 [Chloroflexota bacterium]
MNVQFRLKELMARKERLGGERVTYRDISEATGISPNTLTLLANNRMKHIGLTTIGRLLDFFDCDPGDLIVRIKENDRP